MFNLKEFETALEEVAERYENDAPTVEAWCDYLARSRDEQITLADLRLLKTLHTEQFDGSYAANMVYHLEHRLGRDTAGQIGF
jgi:hypothetical protein